MNRAFTLLESLIVLSIISACLLLSVQTRTRYTSLTAYEKLLRTELLCLQLDSLLYNRKNVLLGVDDHISASHDIKLPIKIDSFSLSVNKAANISQGRTICLGSDVDRLCLRIQIGTGRILVDD